MTTRTLPPIQKPSMVRFNWLSQHPWWSQPYYRCQGVQQRVHNSWLRADGTHPTTFLHAPDNACCWDAALMDWMEASTTRPPLGAASLLSQPLAGHQPKEETMNPICPCCKGKRKHQSFHPYSGGRRMTMDIACGECYGTGILPTRIKNYIAVADGNIYSEGPVSWKAMCDFLEMVPLTELDKPAASPLE